MSATDATDDSSDEPNDETTDGVRFVTEHDTLVRDLADDLRLAIAGDLESDRPFDVRLESDGETMTAGSFDADGLASDMERERFAERADRLAEPDVADAIETHLRELADAHAAGEVEVLDSRTKRVIEATEAVEHDPDGLASDWTVHFSDPETGARSTATLTNQQWAGNPGASLDSQLPSSLRAGLTFAAVPAGEARDDRWRPVRRVYERMATENGNE
jgi:hypothetical protein